MALTFFTLQKSIHGRQFGISTTGGLISGAGSTGSPTSTDIALAAQMWGPGLFDTVSTSSAAVSAGNCGITQISSDLASTGVVTLAAPVKGVQKTIVFGGPATSVLLTTNAAAIKFKTTSTILAAAGSSLLTISVTAAAGIGHSVLQLVGLSTAAWLVVNKSASLTITT